MRMRLLVVAVCVAGVPAAMWMIKRLLVEKWDTERAGTEAAALGLTNASLTTFALSYAQHNKR